MLLTLTGLIASGMLLAEGDSFQKGAPPTLGYDSPEMPLSQLGLRREGDRVPAEAAEGSPRRLPTIPPPPGDGRRGEMGSCPGGKGSRVGGGAARGLAALAGPQPQVL